MSIAGEARDKMVHQFVDRDPDDLNFGYIPFVSLWKLGLGSDLDFKDGYRGPRDKIHYRRGAGI